MHKLKKSLIAIAAAAAVGTSGFFGWRYYADSHVPPIKVYPFSYVGMTEYWGNNRESYGSVTTGSCDNNDCLRLCGISLCCNALGVPVCFC